MIRKGLAVIATIALLEGSLMVVSGSATADQEEQAALTAWWVIFNNPDQCIDGCDGSDLFVAGVDGCVWHATGQVTNEGGVTLVSSHYLQNASDSPFNCLFGLTGGLVNTLGAEIHLVARTHGEPAVENLDDLDELDPGDLADLEDQLARFNGGCQPDDLDDPADDACIDLQFAVHAPDPGCTTGAEAGCHTTRDVFWFDAQGLEDGGLDPEIAVELGDGQIAGARSTLWRTADSVTMTFSTSLEELFDLLDD